MGRVTECLNSPGMAQAPSGVRHSPRAIQALPSEDYRGSGKGTSKAKGRFSVPCLGST
jgi:hypothetical protein